MTRIGIIFLLTAIGFNAGANVLIKYGMKDQSALFNNGVVAAVIKILANPFALAGIMFFGIAFVLYSGVLSKLDLSVAYPIMTGAGFLLVVMASYFLFNETISLYRAAGILAIASGIVLISLTA